MTSTTTSRGKTLLTGLAALVALVAIVAGVPWLLTRLAGNPIPSLPSWGSITSALSHPDDGTLLLKIAAIAAWVGWAGFTISVLTQLTVQLRRIRAPRFTGVIAPSLAGRLVAAVLALGALSAVGVGSATTAHAATSTPVAAAAQDAALQTPTAPATTTLTQQVPTQVTVEAGDTLWGIAVDEYGQGTEWPRIYEANKGAPQTGGMLDNPDLIQPGLTVAIPGKTTTITVTVPAPAGDSTESPAPSAPQTSAQKAAEGPAAAAASPSPAAASQGAHGASTTPGTPSAASQVDTHAQTQADPVAAAENAPVVRTVAGLGSIAAAGVLALLFTRRRRQARTRRPGQRLNLPAGAAAIAEAQLRVAADPITVDDLDHLLRHLAAAAAPDSLPPLRAARITANDIELYLAHDHDTLPTPGAALPDQPGTWIVARTHIPHGIPHDALGEPIPAPYPTLVTLGQDEDEAHVLVNLEEVRSLAVDGPAGQDVLVALTLELIAAGWGDEVTVTLVDLLPELAEAIGSDRVTYVDHLEDILASIEYAGGVYSTVMDAAGVDTPTQARAAGTHPETWTPHLIITAAAPTPDETERLTELLISHPHLSLAAVTLGDPLTGWQLTAHSATAATLAPAGIDLTPQVLAPHDLAALLDAFRAADGDMHDGPTWAETLHEEADLADLPDPADATSTPAWLLAPRASHVVDEDAGDVDVDLAIAPALHLVDQAPDGDLVDQVHEETLEEVGDGVVSAEDLTSPAAHLQDAELVDEHPAAHEAPHRQDDMAETVTAALDDVDADPVADQDDELEEPAASATAAVSLTRAPTDLIPTDRPVLRLLGPVRLEGAPGPRPRAPGTALKILTHLALNPGGQSEDLDQAVWPGQEKKATTRDAPVYATRRWLGTAPDGHPYLALWTPDGGYRLADDMPHDWAIFQTLIGPSIGHAPLENLTRALHLVTGKPLTGPRIAETAAETEMIAAIADVAHEVATRALTGGDHQLAAWAAAKGLDVEPVDEALWRDLLRATHLAGHRDKLTDLIRRYHDVMDAIGGDYDDDTATLIHQITHPAHV